MQIVSSLCLHSIVTHTPFNYNAILAGLGIFSGVDLEPEEAIAEPDIIVPIADVEWNAGQDMDFHLLWADYSWMLQEVGMHTDVHEGSALVIGTGCMPNCNYALINAREGVVSLFSLR